MHKIRHSLTHSRWLGNGRYPLLLLLLLLHLTPALAAQAQPPGPPGNPGPPENPGPPPMDFQPPAHADKLEDFVPPGLAIARHESPPGQLVRAGLNRGRGDVLAFANDQIAVVMEGQTVPNRSELEFTLVATHPLTPTVALTTTRTLTHTDPITQPVGTLDPKESHHFLQFSLEVTQNGESVETLDKQVRIVVDIRSLTVGLDPSYNQYFLAYWDEAAQGWRSVPSLTHQEDGLISAEVPHFSEWAAGVLPERWQPSWVPPTVATFSGAATYSYPFNIPPGRNGLQPDMMLSYSSRALDGRIHSSEESLVADGWSLAEISVVRVGVTLRVQFGILQTYHPNNFRLVLNGAGHQLVPESLGATINNTVRYYVENAPGYRVTRYYDAAIGNIDGLYWIVDAPNGSRYRLGHTAAAVEWNQVGAGWAIAEEGHTGERWDTSVFAWHVDTVTDTFGNQMQYDYFTSTVTESEPLTLTTQKNRLDKITYNYTQRYSGSLPVPIGVARPSTVSGNVAGSKIEFLPANSTSTITQVNIYHGSVTTPVREYWLSTTALDTPSAGNGASGSCQRLGNPVKTLTYVLNSITEKVAGYALPTTTFAYTPQAHHQRNNYDCFIFQYLEDVWNGYGSHVWFVYSGDARSIGSFVYNAGTGKSQYPDVGYTYFVAEKWASDGRNPNVKTTYTYETPCYNQTLGSPYLGTLSGAFACPEPVPPGGTQSTSPEFGPLTGFNKTTVRHYDYNGSSLLSVAVTYFSQTTSPSVGDPSNGLLGQPYQEDRMGSDGSTVLSRVLTEYATTLVDNIARFTTVRRVRNYQYQNGTSSTDLSSKVEYAYDPTYQIVVGGSNGQFGNRTHTLEYDSASATTPYRTTKRWYYPSALGDYWLVNKVGAEAIYPGNSNTFLTATWTYYDNNANWLAKPTQGAVTRLRRVLVDPTFGCSNTPNNGGAGCAYAYKTADTTYAYSGTAGLFGNQTGSTTYRNYYYQTFSSSLALINNGPLTPDDTTNTTFAYDSPYYLYPVSVTTPLGTTTFQIYGFNGVGLGGFQKQPGLLRQVSPPHAVVTKYEYDPFGRLHAVYDGGASTGSSDDFAGFEDSNNNKWDGDPVARYRYWDNLWNDANRFLNPVGNAPFMVTTERRPGSFATTTSSSGYAFNEQVMYDGLGRPIQTRSVWNWVEGQNKSQEIISSTTYGANGQVNCQTAPYNVAYYSDRGLVWPASPFVIDPCSSKPRTTTTYDALERPLLITAPDGSLTTYSYYVISTHTVDGRNRLALTNITDANSHVLGQATNSLGQLALVQENSGTNPYTAETTTRYYYDLLGNLDEVGTSNASTSDPSSWLRRSTMTYDGLGRKTGMNDADMGVWNYTYDAQGNLLTQVDAIGENLCFAYDSLNRLQYKRHNDDNDGCETSDTQLAFYSYFSSGTGDKGQLQETRWSDSASQNRETFDYDTLGRLTNHNRYVDARFYTLVYSSFDALHRPGTRTITYPGGNTEATAVAFDHEGENSLTAGGTPLIDNLTYNGRGQTVELTHSGAAPDTRFNYYGATDSSGGGLGDSNFRLNSIEHGAFNDQWPIYIYNYDKVGNMTRMYADTNTASDDQNFLYDHLNRLTNGSATGGVADYSHNTSATDYNYDKAGNITYLGNNTVYNYTTWHANCPTPLPTQTMPDAVRQVGSNYYCYNKNGSMTKRVEGSTTYTQVFDVENRLVSVTPSGGMATAFSYDANGQRVKTEMGSKIIYYPFPGYEEEVNGTALTRRVTYTVAGQAVANRVHIVSPTPASNTLYHLYTDHLGSTSALSTTTGGTVAGSSAYYYPFGNYRGTPPTQTITDRDFTGQRENREIGLVYYNARFYAPSISRFISADTLVSNPANPQAFNRYTYSYNNPIKYTDPSGHCSVLTYATGSTEDCWNDKEKGLWANWFEVGDKYLIDARHMKSARDRGEELLNQIRNAVESGSGYVSLTRPKGYGDYARVWAVSGAISEAEIVGVAYAIYQEFELGFEAYQLEQGGIESLSGYAIEDLPSDHLGFWAGINGIAEDELFGFLEGLGEVSKRFTPPITVGSGVDGAGNQSSGFVKNYSFEPMTIEFAPYKPTFEAFPWPIEFQLQPLNDSTLYFSES